MFNVHHVIDTMTSPKNRTNSLLAYIKHLKLKKLEGRAERCGTEDIRVKCNAANIVFNGNCGLEAREKEDIYRRNSELKYVCSVIIFDLSDTILKQC